MTELSGRKRRNLIEIKYMVLSKSIAILLLVIILVSCETTESLVEEKVFNGKVAFIVRHSNFQNTALHTMNLDGSDHNILDINEKFSMKEPHWSKDGKKIIYVAITGFYGGHLAIINADGTFKQNIPNEGHIINFGDSPRFNPDSKGFAYTSHGIAGANPRYHKFIDSSSTQIFDTYRAYEFGQQPWSIDGKKILISTSSKNETERVLFLVDIISGSYQQIGVTTRAFLRPILSSDENEVIFSTSVYGHPETLNLYRLNINTHSEKKLTFDINGLKVMYPKYWTRDKRYLFFTADNDDDYSYTHDLLYHDFNTGRTKYLIRNSSYDLDVWIDENI